MALSQYTILVADYIPMDMLLFKIMLKRAHCHLLTATDSTDALKQAKEKRPDLILLDVHMPEMNGFEVAATLQNEACTRDIPILFVADMGDYPIFNPEGKILGEQEYIGKPFNTSMLVKRILQQLKTAK